MRLAYAALTSRVETPQAAPVAMTNARNHFSDHEGTYIFRYILHNSETPLLAPWTGRQGSGTRCVGLSGARSRVLDLEKHIHHVGLFRKDCD